MPATVIPFPAKWPETAVHAIKIERAVLGFTARCSCGWRASGLDKRRLEAMAGSHDLDDGDAA